MNKSQGDKALNICVKNPSQMNDGEKYLWSRHIDVTLISHNGCTVHIVGDVDYTLIPPKITGFHGTVTISGKNGCPNGTLTFDNVIGSDLQVAYDIDDPCRTGLLTWAGPSEYTDILSETEINDALITEIRKLCEN